MGKASSRKQQQRRRQQRRGRGRRPPAPGPSRSPLLFLGLAAVAVIGVVLLRTSDGGDDSPAGRAGADERPVAGEDHWHAAIGFYVCDRFVGPFPDEDDPLGIHSHDDGLIHLHPFSDEAAGRNATLDKFLDAIGATVTAERIALPDGTEGENGERCGDAVGQVQVAAWDGPEDPTGEPVSGDPGRLRLRDRQLITVAFAPEGAEIPKPPSAARLADPGDV